MITLHDPYFLLKAFALFFKLSLKFCHNLLAAHSLPRVVAVEGEALNSLAFLQFLLNLAVKYELQLLIDVKVGLPLFCLILREPIQKRRKVRKNIRVITVHTCFLHCLKYIGRNVALLPVRKARRRLFWQIICLVNQIPIKCILSLDKAIFLGEASHFTDR